MLLVKWFLIYRHPNKTPPYIMHVMTMAILVWFMLEMYLHLLDVSLHYIEYIVWNALYRIHCNKYTRSLVYEVGIYGGSCRSN